MLTSAVRVTQAEYARMREISRQRVNQLVKDGRIPLDEEGFVLVDQADTNLAAMLDQRRANRERQMAFAAGVGVNPAGKAGATHALGDVPASRAEGASSSASGLAGNEEAEEAGPTAGHNEARASGTQANAAADYWAHKAKREAADAQLAELRLQERLATLIDADEVRRSRRETATKIASALMQIPAQIAPVVATMTDAQACERLMLDRIRKVLHELATDLETAPPEREEPRAA